MTKLTKHPSESELALLAGGDVSFFSRFRLQRHVHACEPCQDTLAEFAILREDLASSDVAGDSLPDPDWARLSAEMTANIHLGLEAGECVRVVTVQHKWDLRLTAAFASLLLLLGAGLTMRTPQPVLESTGVGVAVRNGQSSLTLMNHQGAATAQTVSAQGEIRSGYVEGGSVTFNAVYLE